MKNLVGEGSAKPSPFLFDSEPIFRYTPVTMTSETKPPKIENGSEMPAGCSDLASKHRRLEKILGRYDSLMVAYSGGVDSTLLAKVAFDVLSTRAVAVTADSPSLPRSELGLAKQCARTIGIRHLVIATDEMRDPRYLENSTNRCYFCKSELYAKLLPLAKKEKIKYIANGTNLDDLGDYRPGLRAADQYHVVSPLRDAGMTKQDVRCLARSLNLPVWDKPASPCLSSRIPYGREVTTEKLAAIEAAENCLRSLGLTEVRVRHFGLRARIEVNEPDFAQIQKGWKFVQRTFNSLGFREIELQKFKSGALNDLANVRINSPSPRPDALRQD